MLRAELRKWKLNSVEAVSCSDGTILAREQVEASNKDQVIPALGTVVAALRQGLGESLSSIQTFDVPMEKATTTSLDALKAHSLGVDERARGKEKASVPFFQHAIALDPHFAIAYVQLGVAYRNLGETEQAGGWSRRLLTFGRISALELNRFDEARQVCQQAAAVQRDSLSTHRVLYDLAFIRHDQTAMHGEQNWAQGTERENDMLVSEAAAQIAEGKVQSGRQLYQRSWASSLGSKLNEDSAYSIAGAALAEADLGNRDQARSYAATALQQGRGIDPIEMAAEALALTGDTRRSEALVNELRQRFPKHSVLNQSSIPATLAAIQLQKRNPRKR